MGIFNLRDRAGQTVAAFFVAFAFGTTSGMMKNPSPFAFAAARAAFWLVNVCTADVLPDMDGEAERSTTTRITFGLLLDRRAIVYMGEAPLVLVSDVR
jgi:hypothetical protein